MNESDESDEVVLPGKWATKDALGQHSTRPFKVPSRPHHDLEALKLATHDAFRKSSDRRISQASSQWTEGLHKGVGLPSDDQTEQPTSSAAAMKENCRSELVVDGELERLRKEIVINAHRRAREDSTASPEMLSRCRDGPGTDRTSQFYRELGNVRVIQQEVPDSSYLPGSSHMFSTEIQENAEAEQLRREFCGRLRLYRESYKKSPKAFPILTENGKYILLPMPTEEHESALERIQADRERIAEPVTNFDPTNYSNANGKKKPQVLKNSWTDFAIVDWEYCPRGLARSDSDKVAYRARFQNWLESTIRCEYAVDIFRQPFFNGFAHADGETSMFILDMRKYETHLNPNDKESWLHAHETVAGYCYNINLQEREAEEAEEHRRKMELQLRREARREPLRSPHSPVANIYLRPVDVSKDTPDLREIYNWYTQNSFVSPNIHAIDENEVRQRIEECRSTNLPHIVAVDRRAEKILGYALAREFDRHAASRFTAELEIYVKDEHTNLGIGRCLLDKLLEICDPTYIPKCGCSFETSKEERSGYYPGGKRRLTRLIFTLCYVDMKAEDIFEYKRVKNWLMQRGEFEEQGLLRGIRVKKNYLINVAYLVRTTGHSELNKLDF
ncbi:hypothetical protein BDW67DRAFT_182704 [Aspergillus spinulosporus]